MSRLKVDRNQKKALAIVTLIAVIVGLFFLKKYLILIMIAAILAYVFNPVYQHFVKRGKSPNTAASYTLLISFLSVIIPVSLIIVITTFQIAHLYDTIKNSTSTMDFGSIGQKLLDWINSTLAHFGASYQLTTAEVSKALSQAVENISGTLLKNFTSSLSGFFASITTAIIYMYVFLSLLKNQNKIIDMVHKLNPLGKDISTLYVERMGAMTKAMVRGQFIIAFLQGTTDALLIWLGGLHEAFFFFWIILVALSVVPLGGGILAIPIGIAMILTGNIWGGLLVIGGHLLIVTNIDNVTRPRLVPEEARLDGALTMLAVFSGLALFGFVGIVLGPVVMIVLVTTIQVYLDVYKGDSMREFDPKKHNEKKLRHIFGFLKKDKSPSN